MDDGLLLHFFQCFGGFVTLRNSQVLLRKFFAVDHQRGRDLWTHSFHPPHKGRTILVRHPTYQDFAQLDSRATSNRGSNSSHGKICSFMQPAVSHMGEVRLCLSLQLRTKIRPFSSGRHLLFKHSRNKGNLPSSPGPATKSTCLSKWIIKLCILGITLVSWLNSFTKYSFLKGLFFWTTLAVQLAVSALL